MSVRERETRTWTRPSLPNLISKVSTVAGRLDVKVGQAHTVAVAAVVQQIHQLGKDSALQFSDEIGWRKGCDTLHHA